MTLATHAVVGGLLGAVAAQNPILAAFIGFTSHFLMDAIPHWDYKLRSSNEDIDNPMENDISPKGKDFAVDLVKIGFDAILGLVIVYAMFYTFSATILIGAFVGALFAVLPDALQFVYMRFKHEPLTSLQRFHLYMHAKLHLKRQAF